MKFSKYISPLLLTTAMALGTAMASTSAVAVPAEMETFNDTSVELCLASIDSSIEETQNLSLLLNPDLMAVDAAVIGGSVAAALPTAFAALPAGVALLAVRNVGASTYKQAKLSSQGRAKQVVLDSAVYLQLGQHNRDLISDYPGLEELMVRVNGPFKTLIGRGYSAEQVAKLVMKASQDQDFCGDAGNYRMVHLKDYVLTNI